MVKPSQELEQITYFRVKKPPTLKQFVHRRHVREVMNQVKGETGVDATEKVPASAIKARELMAGKTADDILLEHPSWKDDYEKEYGDGTGNKEA